MSATTNDGCGEESGTGTVRRAVLAVFADYGQFYLVDHDMDPEAPTDATEEIVNQRIHTAPYLVEIMPERDMEVSVELEFRGHEPDETVEGWDHVAEASLHLPSGRLRVDEVEGPVAEFDLEPGWYRVRSYHGGFDTIGCDGLEGDDHYRVVLWPAPPAPTRILKQAPPR